MRGKPLHRVRRTRHLPVGWALAAAMMLFSQGPLGKWCLADEAPATQPADTTLRVEFDQHGLSALSIGTVPLLSSGQFGLRDLRYPDSGANGDDFSVKSSTFDADHHVLEQTYPWGTLRVVYLPEPDQLRMSVSVTNSGSRPIAHLGVCLMNIVFPATPDGVDWQNRYPIYRDRLDNFPIIMADWKSARLALCTDDLDQKAIFGYQPLPGQPYEVMLRFEDQPIQPGATRAATIFLRAGGPEHSCWTMVADLLHAYAKKYPAELNWPDRRPIGSVFLATANAGYAHNPRGWLMDSTVDTDTEAGRDEFHKKVTAYMDQVLQHCKEMNAQGVIVWDLEGQQMPHATSYLADPRMLAKVAPEMDAIADELFSRMSKAGLRTGLAIRPTRVVADSKQTPDGRQGWAQQDVPDVLAEMDDKINYAHQRWGCTIFYCDSNVDFVRDETGKILSDPPISTNVFATLARRHPDCLLIPEHKTDRYWAYTAPYGEYRLGFTGTPEPVRIAYPNAFSVLRLVDGPALDQQDSIDALVPSIRAGDVALFRPWWDDPQTRDIEHLYELAHAHP